MKKANLTQADWMDGQTILVYLAAVHYSSS